MKWSNEDIWTISYKMIGRDPLCIGYVHQCYPWTLPRTYLLSNCICLFLSRDRLCLIVQFGLNMKAELKNIGTVTIKQSHVHSPLTQLQLQKQIQETGRTQSDGFLLQSPGEFTTTDFIRNTLCQWSEEVNQTNFKVYFLHLSPI